LYIQCGSLVSNVSSIKERTVNFLEYYERDFIKSFAQDLYNDLHGKFTEEAIKFTVNERIADKMNQAKTWRFEFDDCNVLHIPSKIFIDFMLESIKSVSSIVRGNKKSESEGKIEGILEKVPEIDYIILVGGFSESRLISESLAKEFKDYNVICPSAPSVAVVKGAVVFGMRPQIIYSRKSRFTLGVRTYGDCFTSLVQANSDVTAEGGVYRPSEPLYALEGSSIITFQILKRESSASDNEPSAKKNFS